MSLRQQRARPQYLRQRNLASLLSLVGYQFREDNGTEVTASYVGAFASPLTQGPGDLRLRFQVNGTADPVARLFRIQYRVNGGVWKYVNPEGL